MTMPVALHNVLIVMIVFGGLTAIVGLSLFIPSYFQAQKRKTILKTVELFSARNQPVPPEIMDSLVGERRAAPEADLRRGVVLLSIALAMAVLGMLMNNHPLIGVAAFPGLIGAAFIGLHVYTARRSAA